MIYAAANEEAKIGLFRLEVTTTAGTGRLRIPAGLDRGLKELLNRAFSYLQSPKDRLRLAQVLAEKTSMPRQWTCRGATSSAPAASPSLSL